MMIRIEKNNANHKLFGAIALQTQNICTARIVSKQKLKTLN